VPDVTETEAGRTDRRRRGGIILAVAALLVVVPLGLNWWFESQAAEQAEQLAETVQVGAQSIDEEDMETLRLQEVAGDGSGGFALALGLQDEWQGTDLDRPVRLVFEARSGWVSRCVKVELRAGAAETEIATPDGGGCTLAD
jgi:hypothetical protein